jgi:site-specific recombinase XerD
MLDMYLKTPKTIQRLRSGPLGPYMDGFAATLKERGYSYTTASKYLRSASHFGWFVHRHKGTVGSINDETLVAFRRHLTRCRCPLRHGGKAIHHTQYGAKLFVKFLRDIGVIKRQSANRTKDTELPVIVAFRQWLETHRGSAKDTLRLYCRGAVQLLDQLGSDTSRYDAKGVRGFFQRQASQISRSSAEKLATSLRAFLRYLSIHGNCQTGLDRAIPTVAGWRLATLPRCLTATEVQRILDYCDGDSHRGIRNRAIILLLARLGLRAGDVAGLRLSDIDWQNGTVVVAGKARRQVTLPLPQEIGDAILKYLECRPRVETDRVFVTAIAPFQPFRRGDSVSSVVKRAMQRAGVESPRKGAHILRHTAATEMLRQGCSLYQIGSVLRHRTIDTTAYYAKVDVALLKLVAQPWPEVIQ